MNVASDLKMTRRAAYGRNYSYFSHRIFVSYLPEDFHRYLHRLIVHEDSGNADAERLDMKVFRWFLLHKSQLNALALNRQIEAMRGEGDTLRFPEDGRLRTDRQLRLEITLQFALEIEIALARKHHLVQERPRLQLALLDAAYYVSRLRADVDKPEQGLDIARVDIDLSTTGRAPFAQYLLARMNLHEDRPPGAEVDDEDTPPFSEEEIDWLMGVAIGVARTLSSSITQDDLKRRWQEAIASRWEERGLPPPDQALYDVLLIDKESPLMELHPDASAARDEADPFVADSLQFQWRVPKFPDKPWANSIRGVANASARFSDGIRQIHANLLSLMFGESAGASGTAGDAPLSLLSDTYRVLPTTPAWSSVVAAMERMDLAAKGLGELKVLLRDRDLLKSYTALLLGETGARAVVLALSLAAAIDGFSKNPTLAGGIGSVTLLMPGKRLDAALSLLRDGLQLFDADLTLARSRLEDAALGLGQVIPIPEALERETRPLIGEQRVQALNRIMSACFEAGYQQNILPEAVRARAEASLVVRLQALVLHGVSKSVLSAEELACTSVGTGVHDGLPPLLVDAGCRSWTRLLLSVLRQFRAGVYGDRAESLAVIAAFALERLGVGSLSTTSRRLLLEVVDIPDEHADKVFRSIPNATNRKAAVGSNRCALVICGNVSRVAERWTSTPRTCFAMALTEQELESQNRSAIVGLAKSLDTPIRIALEPQVGEPRRVAELFGAVTYDSVSVYDYMPVDVKGNVVAAPDSADQLWP